MSTERTKRTPPLLQHVVEHRLWGDAPLYLLDVGASGGIDRQWKLFGSLLRAVGFEPLVSEAERLNAAAAGTGVRYEPAFVTCRHFDRLFPADVRNDAIRSKTNEVFPRTSAARAQEILRMNYAEHVFNSGSPAMYSDVWTTLDEYVPASEYGAVDFLKVDTDGHDIEVLLGADALLTNGVLGVSIEAQFHGPVHEYSNTFANIDRIMRGRGFSLFDLEVYRYSRGVFPAPFVYDIPAQTRSGQVLWGEAVYFRDLADPDYERKWPLSIAPEHVLKLACLFELFGISDCAGELLLARGAFLQPSVREHLLNLLVPAVAGEEKPVSYARYVEAFEGDVASFYASARKAARGAAVTADDLRARNEKLQQRVRKREEQLQKAQKRIEELKNRLKRSPAETRPS